MIKPTLLVLAAGMGSRFGSLKQMEGIGPCNEAIIDYSVYDAVRAGFGKVVFVIRHSFENEFRAQFNERRFNNRIEVEYVFQELDKLPEGFTVPYGREKPWGTNHAVIMAAEAIHTPFAVVNADDFYGADAFETIASFLIEAVGKSGQYCMVAYGLENTLSDFGTVSRGVCTIDSKGNLERVVERAAIERIPNGSIVYREEGNEYPLDSDTPVSMNFFGFTPDYFERSKIEFTEFLRHNFPNLKSEFFMPSMVNKLIGQGDATVKVLTSSSKWFGVTYKEDKPSVVAKLGELIGEGIYPHSLWE